MIFIARVCLTLLIPVAFLGCASVHVPNMVPEVNDISESSEIWICRRSVFVSDGGATVFTLNNLPILRGHAGIYTKFKVESGEYVVGVMTSSWGGLSTDGANVIAKPGTTHYLTSVIDKISIVDEEALMKCVERSVFVKVQ